MNCYIVKRESKKGAKKDCAEAKRWSKNGFMPIPLMTIPPENIERALAVAADGKPTRDILAALGCGKDKYYKLRGSDAVFERRLQQARAIGRETLAESVLELVDNDPFGDPQLLKLKSDNLKWFLGVQDPAKYGQRQTLTVESVDIGAALTEAKNRARLIDITPLPPQIEQTVPNPFE